MPSVGQIEKRTQQRVVTLLRDRMGYRDLGDWGERGGQNIEPDLLLPWLRQRGVQDALAQRALHELQRVAGDTSRSLYDRNQAVYGLLHYGIQLRPEAGEKALTVDLIDWKQPLANDFAVAQEVTVPALDPKARTKRPDVVLYVNGIALAVLELKRSTVSVSEGIRQNLDNQKKEFIQHFFSTMQWVTAANGTEGLRYGTIETPEKYYLKWVEEVGDHAGEPNELDRQWRSAASERWSCKCRRIRPVSIGKAYWIAGTAGSSRHCCPT